jgi:hypothetical protein
MLTTVVKLLIHNWPGILSTLEKLEKELESEKEDNAQETVPEQQNISPIADKGHADNTGPASGTSSYPGSPDSKTEEKDMGGDSENENSTTTTESTDKEKKEKRENTESLGNIPKPNLDKKLEEAPDKTELAIRVEHLSCLRDFIKTDLGHFLGLRLKVQEGSLETITFEDLYHLYWPGDLVINRKTEKVDSLHQVYGVTGGRMRLLKYSYVYKETNHPEEADNSPDAGIGTWTDLVVDSFQYAGTEMK